MARQFLARINKSPYRSSQDLRASRYGLLAAGCCLVSVDFTKTSRFSLVPANEPVAAVAPAVEYRWELRISLCLLWPKPYETGHLSSRMPWQSHCLPGLSLLRSGIAAIQCPDPGRRGVR